jgi:hypothetical protein
MPSSTRKSTVRAVMEERMVVRAHYPADFLDSC